ncbi:MULTISPECIES: hypothetical protein [unclassified Thioalkalivibrio]|uniref:hypothetical protein n=1 Tax=unclassified Thioalkalivibrio TaxID=2621013 RepID=UPI0004768F00|nr:MULTISPECIES: hypothetical protein [unclassified Thioalkalivibrio]
MALKDKPHSEYHQDPFLRWLSHWYEKPQGRRVRERLLQRIRQHAAPGPGEVAIELSPVPMLEESDTLGGPIVRMDSSRPGLLMEPEFWPLESDCARRIVLAHPCAYSDLPAAVVAEAARVLEPEGMIFMLEGNRLQLGDQGGVRVSPLPEGLRRRQYREFMESADLEVLEQWSLSLLPPGLSETWQQRLAPVDAWTRRGLPPLASVILTVAHKRVDLPLRPATQYRFASPGPRLRPGLVSSRTSSRSESKSVHG